MHKLLDAIVLEIPRIICKKCSENAEHAKFSGCNSSHSFGH